MLISIRYSILHSSEIGGLCLMKWSSEILQNLPSFWHQKIIIWSLIKLFFFFFSSYSRISSKGGLFQNLEITNNRHIFHIFLKKEKKSVANSNQIREGVRYIFKPDIRGTIYMTWSDKGGGGRKTWKNTWHNLWMAPNWIS